VIRAILVGGLAAIFRATTVRIRPTLNCEERAAENLDESGLKIRFPLIRFVPARVDRLRGICFAAG
jgi:hypothetical protein